jgi:hypothetical protein
VLINKVYEPKNQNKNIEPTDKEGPLYSFYGVPDHLLYPADYEAMNNFREMTINYLYNVRLKKGKEGNRLFMVDYENKELQEQNAFLLINSVPIFDFNVIEAFNTSTINKIETKNAHIVYGELNLYGILSLELNPKLASVIFSTQHLQSHENNVMVYENFSPFIPNAVNSERIPDFRQILYWNPEIILDNNNETNIEFTASAYKAKYTIVVQGISSGNVPAYAKSIIEIK